jgi:hypothetical protein
MVCAEPLPLKFTVPLDPEVKVEDQFPHWPATLIVVAVPALNVLPVFEPPFPISILPVRVKVVVPVATLKVPVFATTILSKVCVVAVPLIDWVAPSKVTVPPVDVNTAAVAALQLPLTTKLPGAVRVPLVRVMLATFTIPDAVSVKVPPLSVKPPVFEALLNVCVVLLPARKIPPEIVEAVVPITIVFSEFVLQS